MRCGGVVGDFLVVFVEGVFDVEFYCDCIVECIVCVEMGCCEIFEMDGRIEYVVGFEVDIGVDELVVGDLILIVEVVDVMWLVWKVGVGCGVDVEGVGVCVGSVECEWFEWVGGEGDFDVFVVGVVDVFGDVFEGCYREVVDD